jgi:hypothetical protein
MHELPGCLRCKPAAVRWGRSEVAVSALSPFKNDVGTSFSVREDKAPIYEYALIAQQFSDLDPSVLKLSDPSTRHLWKWISASDHHAGYA